MSEITEKNVLNTDDIKGVLVLVEFEDGMRQILTNRKTELAILNICVSLADNRTLKMTEEPLEGISIDYPEGNSFTDYVKSKKK